MFNSWFHIRALARRMQAVLPGSNFGRPFTFQKGELQIPVSGCSAFEGVHFSIQAPLPFLDLSPSLPRPKNKISVLDALAGLRIEQVRWHRSDRQILISTQDNSRHLLLQLYGINGNAFVLDGDFGIEQSFKKSDRKLSIIDADFTDAGPLCLSETDFYDLLARYPEKQLSKWLGLLPIPVFTGMLIAEICNRCGLAAGTLIVNISAPQREILFHGLNTVFREIDRAAVRLYFCVPPVFAMLPLQSHAGIPAQDYSDISEAGRNFLAQFFRSFALEEKRKALLRRIQHQIQTLTRTSSRQIVDLQNLPSSGSYRQWADLLMANLNRVPSGQNSVSLPDIEFPDRPVAVSLNPKLTPYENAARYYEKSRGIDQSRSDLADTIRESRQQIDRLWNLLQELGKATEMDSLRRIEKSLPVLDLPRVRGMEDETHQPYTEFSIDGWPVLVGRSAQDNDVLTFRHARPDDLWFHAQNITGSHVILRTAARKIPVPGSVMEKVAGIAAFFCKAKHSGLVSVVYTLRKYVRKNKKMHPGQVVIQFEKSIIVAPFNPKTR